MLLKLPLFHQTMYFDQFFSEGGEENVFFSVFYPIPRVLDIIIEGWILKKAPIKFEGISSSEKLCLPGYENRIVIRD